MYIWKSFGLHQITRHISDYHLQISGKAFFFVDNITVLKNRRGKPPTVGNQFSDNFFHRKGTSPGLRPNMI